MGIGTRLEGRFARRKIMAIARNRCPRRNGGRLARMSAQIFHPPTFPRRPAFPKIMPARGRGAGRVAGQASDAHLIDIGGLPRGLAVVAVKALLVRPTLAD